MARTESAKPTVRLAAALLVLGLALALVACLATTIHGEALRWMQVLLYAGMGVTVLGVVAMVAVDGIGPAKH